MNKKPKSAKKSKVNQRSEKGSILRTMAHFGSTNKTLLIIAAVILISILAISSNLINRSFTSDDVAQQTISHNLVQHGPRTLLVGNDTYFLKIPIYMAFNSLMQPGRTQLLLEAIFFNSFMIILLIVWWRAIISKSPDKWLVLIWLLSAGVYWIFQTINPNTRNVDLALMLLFGLFTLSKISAVALSRKAIFSYITCSSIVGGILTYEDPYFLFFVLIPLLISIVIYFLRKKSPFPIFAAGIVLIISQVVFKALAIIFTHIGLSVGKLNEINFLSSSITSLSNLPEKIIQALNLYLSLIGASPSYSHANIYLLIGVIINLCVVSMGLFSLYDIFHNRKFTLINLWIISTIIVAFGYVTLTGANILQTFRYLIILVPITGLLVTKSIQLLAAGKKIYYRLAIILLVFSVIFNITRGLQMVLQNHQTVAPNAVDYQIIHVLDKNRVIKSYGDYWVANISYYLSNYRDNVLPTSCLDGIEHQDPVLLDTQRFFVPETETGIIVGPDITRPSRTIGTTTLFRAAASCTIQATIKQFGTPEKIVIIAPHISLLIYNHNPF